MVKALTLVGARPQFMKLLPLSKEFAAAGIDEYVVHSGQHFSHSMSGTFFEEFGLPEPYRNLGHNEKCPGERLAKIISSVSLVINEIKPEFVLVYGDTDTTLAGSLAANKLGVPLLHVEAGLRSFNNSMPEEHNRRISDHLSDITFAPNKIAFNNLRQEGVSPEKIELSGDVMMDTFRLYFEKSRSVRFNNFLDQLLVKPFIYFTLHREENTRNQDNILTMLEAFRKIDMPTIWPIHPRMKKLLACSEVEIPANVKIIEPVGYMESLKLVSSATLVATDSGGLQREAYWSGTNCITLRSETEWIELLTTGISRLNPISSSNSMLNLIEQMISNCQPKTLNLDNNEPSKAIVKRIQHEFC